MKKTYINPETRIVFVATHTVIAGSNPEGFKGTLNESGTDANSLLSRENNNLWDWEEDEE